MDLSAVTPRSQGYRMPAEWERHDATWLSWPKNPLTFPQDMIEDVEDVYCQMVRALSSGERVNVLVDDEALESRARTKVEGTGADLAQVSFVRIKSADVWMRDYGPTFLLHSLTRKKAAVKWTFNAWGGKYDDLLYDNVAGEDVVKASGVEVFRPGMVMEGGSIDVNGKGTVLTTEQCLLNRNRNPSLNKGQIEDHLREYLGVSHIVWLKSGIDGDDTDGHVDDFARFVGDNRVLCAYERSDDVFNHAVLKKNLDILRSCPDLKVEELPMPRPIRLEEEDRYLPASYANFYIGNKVVLLPVFKDRNDDRAIDLLRESFPEREIVPIYARDLVYGYGGIHCITQQEPSAKPF